MHGVSTSTSTTHIETSTTTTTIDIPPPSPSAHPPLPINAGPIHSSQPPDSWTFEVTEQTYPLPDGLVIAAKVWGPPDGIPVLGLHGWLDNAATFDRVAPYLAEAGIKLVAIDFPGHGKSSYRSIDAVYHFTDYVYYALAVTKQLGWKNFALLGHSLGASIALCLAGSYPEVVSRTVCIEGLTLISKHADTAPKTLREAIKQRTLLVEMMGRKSASKVYANVDAAVQARLASLSRLPGNQTLEEQSARLLVLRGVGPANDPRAEDVDATYPSSIRFRHDQRLSASAHTYLTEEQSRSFLSTSTCPVLLIKGDNGWPSTPEESQAKAALLGERLEVISVPGSHHLHLDEATCSFDKVISPIISFLKKEDV